MKKKSTKPKILYWDIENTHSIVATFPMWKANISYEAVLQEWYIICASWKWEGEKRIHSVSVLDNPRRFKKDVTDDYHVVKELHRVLSEADAVIAHNGDAFDMKKFNARAIFHGLPPLPSIVQIDTLKMAKSKFKFNFNKLDSLAHYLRVGSKLKTDLKLWLDCLHGKRRAIQDMVKYNKMDVEVLEKVYKKLAPYCPSKLNHNHFTQERVCPTCGSTKLTVNRYRLTRVGKMVQLQCKDCGGFSSFPVSKKGVQGFIR